MIFKNQSIARIFLSMTLIIAILLSISTAVISILTQYRGFRQTEKRYEAEYVKNQKELIKNTVNGVLDWIEYEKSRTKDRLKQNLKKQVDIACEIAMNIYKNNKGKQNDNNIKTIIIDLLSHLRNSENEYYWILDSNGNIVMHPLLKGANVENLGELKDVFQNSVDKVLNKKTGSFVFYQWKKPNQNAPLLKISYVKYFQPYDWIIGSGAYLYDIEPEIQKDILTYIQKIRLGKARYIQIFTFDGTVISDLSGNFNVGENISEITDANGIKIIPRLLNTALSNNDGYLSYLWKNKAERVSGQIVFVKPVHEWNWLICASVVADELRYVISENKKVLKENVINQIIWSLNLFFLVLTVCILFAFLFSNIMKKEFQIFISFLNNVVTTHTHINKEGLYIKELRLLADVANKMCDEIINSRQKLSEREAQYRTFVETIPHGIQETDIFGTITFLNPSYGRIYSYEIEELIGTSMLNLVSSDSEREFLRNYLKKLAKEEPEPTPFLTKNLKKDGTIIDIQVDWNYKKDNQGNIVGFISVITDITERREAEDKIRNLNKTLEQKVEARTIELEESIRQLQEEMGERQRVLRILRQTEENLAKAQEIAHIGSWECNLLTNDLTWSDETYRIFGIDQDKFTPSLKGILNYVHPEDKKPNLELIERSIKSRQIAKFEQRIFRQDGKMRYLQIHCETFYDDEETPVRMIGTAQDITEIKNTEQELKKAKEDAEIANCAKSEFLANMSHEIRTPMNAILGFSEILLSKAEKSRDKHYLNMILSSGQSLLSIINDILDLSKIEAGKLELRYDPVQIKSILREILQIFSYKAEEKGIALKTEISNSLPEKLIIDEVRVRQILLNLVGNAIKFTHYGYVRIRIFGDFADPLSSSVKDEKENNETSVISEKRTHDRFHLTLEVEDTGIGIPHDRQVQIFESFRQLDGQKTRKYGGTGLGLTITKKLVEMMKGDISVESKPGKGSIFRICFHNLEVAKESDEISDSFVSEYPLSPSSFAEFEPATILLVEDVLFNRALIKEYLSDTPLSIIEAENGDIALDYLAKEKPDLILMDLKMPGKNGYEVTKIIKKNEALRNIPVIAFTASVMKESEKKITGMFDGYLQKPVNIVQFISELKRFLSYKKTDEPSERLEQDIYISDNNPEVIVNLSELLNILEKNMFPRWKEIRDVFFIDDISEFAEDLKKIAIEYQIRFLENYSNELYQNSQENYIDEIEKLLAQFPQILDKIRKTDKSV